MRGRDDLARRISRFNASRPDRLEHYAPTFVEVSQRNGVSRVRKPLVCNYIFLRGSLEAVREFRSLYMEYNLIRERDGMGYLMISHNDLENFRKVALAYQNNMPCFRPDEVELRKGDRVRIIGGRFNGVEGVLLTQKGKDGGRVVISIGDLLAVETFDIAPRYIQILSFAPGSRHLYDKIDSFIPRLRQALHSRIRLGVLPVDDAAPLDFFIRRFGAVVPSSPKIDAKLTCLLMTSEALLGRRGPCLERRARFLRLLPSVTNPATRISLLSYHAITTILLHNNYYHTTT